MQSARILSPNSPTLLSCLLLLAGLIGLPVHSSDEGTLNVKGHGEVRRKTNAASLIVGMEVEAARPSIALKEARASLRDFTRALERLGVRRDELQTIVESVKPVYNRPKRGEPRRIEGYRGLQQVRVDLRGEDRLELLDKVLELTAREDLNRVGSLDFHLTPEREREAQRQAIRLAAQDALANGEAVLGALNRQLESIQRINVSNRSVHPMPMRSTREKPDMVGSASGGRSHSYPGEVTIKATVHLDIEFEQ